jgi:hypothetical protein
MENIVLPGNRMTRSFQVWVNRNQHPESECSRVQLKESQFLNWDIPMSFGLCCFCEPKMQYSNKLPFMWDNRNTQTAQLLHKDFNVNGFQTESLPPSIYTALTAITVGTYAAEDTGTNNQYFSSMSHSALGLTKLIALVRQMCRKSQSMLDLVTRQPFASFFCDQFFILWFIQQTDRRIENS